LIGEVPLSDGVTLTGMLLDRAGAPMAVPVAMGSRRDDTGTAWATARVALNALAPGDYVLELRDAGGGTIASAFRLVRD